jgi:CheY-like chemotaxis protein
LGRLSESRPIRVLIVEDSPVDRTLYRKMLSESPESYVLTEVDSAEDALELLREGAPDCMLLDHRLPGMSGVEFLRRLAAMPGGVPVPVVMLTALSDELLAFRAMQAGASTILAKGSITTRALRAAINTAIQLEIPRRQRILEAEFEYASVAYTGSAKEPAPGQLAEFAIALEVFRLVRAVGAREPSWVPRGMAKNG